MSMMRLWSWQPASMEPRMGRPHLGGKGVCERSESGHSFRGFRSWVISSSRATKKRATFGVSAAINARTCTTQQYVHLRKKTCRLLVSFFCKFEENSAKVPHIARPICQKKSFRICGMGYLQGLYTLAQLQSQKFSKMSSSMLVNYLEIIVNFTVLYEIRRIS